MEAAVFARTHGGRCLLDRGGRWTRGGVMVGPVAGGCWTVAIDHVVHLAVDAGGACQRGQSSA